MADRNLRYNIGATDTATQVFEKVARSSQRAHKAMQSDFDQSASKVRQYTHVLGALGDDVERDMRGAEQAIDRLTGVLDNDLSFSARDAFTILERGGLSAQDILDATEEDVRGLANELQRLDSVAQQAGGGLRRSMDDTADGLERVHSNADQSRSVLANLAGNTAQDLGEVGGVVGSLGVGLGQLVEYSVDGNIALRNLVSVAGPLAGLAVAGAAFGAIMKDNAARIQRAKEVQEGYTQALLDTESGLAVTSQTAKNFLESDVIDRVSDLGANLENLADAVTDTSIDFDTLNGPLRQFLIQTSGGNVSVDELASAMNRFGVEASPLTDELMRLAESGQLDMATFIDLTRAIGELSTGFQNAEGDVEKRKAIEEALGVAIGETTDYIARQNEQLSLNRQRNDEAREAQMRRLETELGMIDAEIALRNAERDRISAIEDATEATDDQTTAIDEVAAASDRALEAILAEADAVVQAAQDHYGGALTVEQATELQVQSLDRVRQTLDPGSPLHQALTDYINRLNNEIPRNIETNMSLRLNPNFGVGTTPLPVKGPFHGGGVVDAPRGKETLALVQGGEAIFTPEQLAALTPTVQASGVDASPGVDMGRTEFELQWQTKELRQQTRLLQSIALGGRSSGRPTMGMRG